MFTNIEEGLRVYKDKVREYLTKCKKIAEAELRDRKAEGIDYCGSVDWTPEARAWKKATEKQIEGMEAVLGLSLEEATNIALEIAQSL